MKLPPTTTEELLAELQLAQETTQAVADLYAVAAYFSTAVAVAMENAIETDDLAVIQDLRGVLVLLTESLRQLDPSPPARPRLVS